MEKKTICICGGGGLGHVIAGHIAARGKANVNVLTRRPIDWADQLTITLPDGNAEIGALCQISDNPAEVVSDADVVLLCLPGYAIPDELDKIAPYLKPSAYVGSVFSSTGFFQEAFKRLPQNIALWGLQRVPYVSRVEEYGKKANLLSYRDMLHIAIENCDNRVCFANLISEWLDEPVQILGSWMEAAITNSNPLLHTSRLYMMFNDWGPGKYYDHQSLFYEDWCDDASECLVAMDNELFALISRLPVTPGYLKPILDHYESKTPADITTKIKSISAFKGLKTPMIETENGWMPDFSSRYFVEDFEYGLKYIKDLTTMHDVVTPAIDKVMGW